MGNEERLCGRGEILAATWWRPRKSGDGDEEGEHSMYGFQPGKWPEFGDGGRLSGLVVAGGTVERVMGGESGSLLFNCV